ncbi:recombinase [Rhodococcus pyridinivorans AK37]|uniref:Recombinase n=2 Tax=Rhodococcus pyridinivorans TaxID=103816 RepID=H0JKG2_9NOCA|nr:recombinase [Rhodococcus pyridinivorans AK37]
MAEEGECASIARQIADGRDLAEQLGCRIIEVCIDQGVSAYKARRRPGFDRVLELVRGGVVGIVLGWHFDRLCRSMVELEKLIEAAEQKSVMIHTVNAGPLDLSTSAGRMVARILGSVARQESEHHAERRRRANDDRATRGEWVSSRRPFGYLHDGTLNPLEALAIRESTRDVLEGKSVRQVAREWNSRGLITTFAGRQWQPTSVRRVLLNPRNAALRVHRGEIVGIGNWQPIITRGEHEALVALLADPARRPIGPFEKKYQGSGVYQCGICESVVKIHITNRRQSYVCPSYHVRRHQAKLDDYVDSRILHFLSRDADSPKYYLRSIDVSRLEVDQELLRSRLDEAAAMFADGKIDRHQLSHATSKIRSKLVQLNAQVQLAKLTGGAVNGSVSLLHLEEAWRRVPAEARGTIIRQTMKVSIKNAPKGQRGFNPEFVEIAWRDESCKMKEASE